MKFLNGFFNWFSPYVHPFERKVDRFFRNVKSTDGISEIKGQLLKLMKENLVIANVWLEKKYKGYKYLNKKTRRKMYEDTEKIVAKFNEFRAANVMSEEVLRQKLREKNLEYIPAYKEQLLLLMQIMAFFKPGRYYHYIKTASFGKLLRDPHEEKLEGDCNQIVTLYAYLYSLSFPIEDLQIKLLPEHVCLRFKNVDIEATRATFEKYEESDQVLPITEIISTNLLDLTDFREEVQSIGERTMVKSAQLAYAISSLKSFVARNLSIAYRNLAISAMKSKNFDTAIFYLQKTDDQETLLGAYRNAAIDSLERKNFKKAKFYAEKSGDKDLQKTVRHNEGVYYFNQKNFAEALKIFNELREDKMKKLCYLAEYNLLAKQVQGAKTKAAARKYRSTYRKMLDLAGKAGDEKLQKRMRRILEGL